MSAILKIKNQSGGTISVPALQGASAYEFAVIGGYEGTEEEFASAMANIGNGGGNSGGSSSGSTITYTAASGGGLSLSGNAFSIASITGMSANSYGPSSNLTLTYGGTFTIPYITTNTKGLVTAISTKTMTMPAAPSGGGSGSGSSDPSYLYVGSSSGEANGSTSNGGTYLILKNGTNFSRRNISGSGTVTVSSDNSGNITINGTDTNTHNTAYLYVGTSSGEANGSTSNGSTYFILKDGTNFSRRKILGSGSVTVSSDSSGNITINGTDTDTHNTAYLYAGTSSGEANGSTSNGNTYLILKDGTNFSRRKIQGSGSVTVSSDSSGNITINGTDTDTDTHNTAYLYVGTSSGSANASTTNGNTYLILKDGSSVSTRRKISGSGSVTVSSDSSGNITINGTSGTTYSSGTGISVSGSTISLATLNPAAYTSSGGSTTGYSTLAFGPSNPPSGEVTLSNNSTFYIPGIKVDSYGRVTEIGDHKYKLSVSGGTSYSGGTGISVSGSTISLASANPTQTNYSGSASVIGTVCGPGAQGGSYTVGPGGSFFVPGIKIDTYGRVTTLSDNYITLGFRAGQKSVSWSAGEVADTLITYGGFTANPVVTVTPLLSSSYGIGEPIATCIYNVTTTSCYIKVFCPTSSSGGFTSAGSATIHWLASKY